MSYPPSLWGTAWRDPSGGLSAGHRDTRFREQVLLEVVRDWFSKQNYESFRPEPPRQRADSQRIPRPGFARELLVRHDWTVIRTADNPSLRELDAPRRRFSGRGFHGILRHFAASATGDDLGLRS